MKSVIRTALLGGLAMLALSLATAGVAAAATLPEFKPVPAKKKLTITSGTVFIEEGGEQFTCTKSTATGEIASAKALGGVVVKFTGCKTESPTKSGCELSSVHGAKGEIITNDLKGELGTVKTTEAASGAGIQLHAETGNVWTELASNACTPATKVTGALAGEWATTKKSQKTATLSLVGKSGKEKVKKITLDSGVESEPEFVSWSETTSLNATDEIAFEEAVEVT
jgi:hypothetical protein